MYSISGSEREAPRKGRATAFSSIFDTAPKARAPLVAAAAGRAAPRTEAARAARRRTAVAMAEIATAGCCCRGLSASLGAWCGPPGRRRHERRAGLWGRVEDRREG